MQNIFKNSTFNFEKLKEFGFIFNNNVYQYKILILNSELTLFVYVDKKQTIETKIFDNSFNEEYVLYKVESAEGEYVGRVRKEVENVLQNIKNNCCENNIYKSQQAKQIIEYLKTKYNSKLEFLWENDDSAIARRKDNFKWFIVFMKINKQKLAFDDDKVVEIIDLRVDKHKPSIINNKTIFAGFHMNKKSWITICLDDSLQTNNILNLIDNSYNLAKRKKRWKKKF